jgi:hypothetical protein
MYGRHGANDRRSLGYDLAEWHLVFAVSVPFVLFGTIWAYLCQDPRLAIELGGQVEMLAQGTDTGNGLPNLRRPQAAVLDERQALLRDPGGLG